MEDQTLTTEEGSIMEVTGNGMEDQTLTTEEVSMGAIMADLTQITTMDSGMEASMMVTTATKDQIPGTIIMDSGMEASIAVGITEGRMGASILERITTTTDNGTVQKAKVTIRDIGMEKKVMDMMERLEGRTLVSSSVSPWAWLV